jgi:hypothetical protein
VFASIGRKICLGPAIPRDERASRTASLGLKIPRSGSRLDCGQFRFSTQKLAGKEILQGPYLQGHLGKLNTPAQGKNTLLFPSTQVTENKGKFRISVLILRFEISQEWDFSTPPYEHPEN